jgi:DNA-binding MarR family transcriptional regulator
MNNQDPFISIFQTWIEIFMRQSMRHLIYYSQESGLSMQQIRALFRIHDCSRGVSDLGDHLGVSKAAASQMLDRMVEQGFILRSEDPNDRRGKHITLTDKGLEAMQKSVEARQGWLKQLAGEFSSAEKEQIAKSLIILVEKARKIESDPSE